MGDILHALPAVTALRQVHPEWVIDWVVEPHWRALLAADQTGKKLGPAKAADLSAYITPGESTRVLAPEGYLPEILSFPVATETPPIEFGRDPAQPLIDHLHFAPTKAWRKSPFSRLTIDEINILRKAFRSCEYDAVIDLQGAIRSAVVARLSGCSRLIGEANPRELPACWLFSERITTRGAHVIEQDVELASAVAGDKLTPVMPWLPVDPAAEAWADRILPRNAGDGSQPTVLINPGAGWGAKRWPVQRYDAVAQRLIDLGYRILVNVGPGEEALSEVIVRGTGGAATPLACTLAQLIAITRRISLAIAGDTGPLHLACALGRPVVGIYGPTDPSRNGPFGTRFKVLRSPQSRLDHTRHDAPEEGLLTIKPEDVLHAAYELLYPKTAL
jgi:heptosyltransferase-1